MIGLGTWFEVPVRAHWSVFGTVAILTELVGSVVLPAPRTSQAQVWTWLAATLAAVAFMMTLLLHECAHAATARRCGVPVDSITLWMVGGVTRMAKDPPTPRAMALIAAAGPGASIGIGFIVGAASILIENPMLQAATGWLGALAVVLGAVNLLPAAPLDGGRIVYAFLWARTSDRNAALRGAVRGGRMLGAAPAAIGVLLVAMTRTVDGVWVILIGLIIGSAAARQERAGALVRLQGLVARDVMVPAPQAAPEWWTVAQVVAWLGPNPEQLRVMPLIDLTGAPVDAITVTELMRIPPARCSTTRLNALPRHTHAFLARPTTPLSEVAAGLSRTAPAAVVVQDGRAVGLVTAATLVHMAQPSAAHASVSNSRVQDGHA